LKQTQYIQVQYMSTDYVSTTRELEIQVTIQVTCTTGTRQQGKSKRCGTQQPPPSDADRSQPSGAPTPVVGGSGSVYQKQGGLRPLPEKKYLNIFYLPNKSRVNF